MKKVFLALSLALTVGFTRVVVMTIMGKELPQKVFYALMEQITI